jgi:uncharacterized protein YbjQ (UPF0145 family)
MAFFDGTGDDGPDSAGGDPEDSDLSDLAAALARIEAGGIPIEAERRLHDLGAGGSLFTSGLTVGAFALLGQLGPRPLAQVMGASVHQVGWQYLPPPASWPRPPAPVSFGSPSLSWTGSRTAGQMRWNDTLLHELETIGRAWDLARRRALDRLVEETRQVGADAVVGVKLDRGEHDWAAGTVDYMVAGTAIRFAGTEPPGWPALTDLPVADYWKLYQAGYASVGLVATTAVMFVSTAGAVRWQRQLNVTRNQELPELTAAVFAARDTARARLLGQARDHHADGIVGMTFAQRVEPGEFKFAGLGSTPARPAGLGLATYAAGAGDGERSGLVVTFHAAGTAIRRTAAAARYPPETVTRLGATGSTPAGAG